MRFKSLLFLFVIKNYVFAQENELKGCNLVIPEDVKIRQEPQPETEPLIIYTWFNIFRLGDVPNSGGSFGVDVMQAKLNFCGFMTSA